MGATGEGILLQAAKVFNAGVALDRAESRAFEESCLAQVNRDEYDQDAVDRTVMEITEAERDDLIERIGWLLMSADETLRWYGSSFDEAIAFAESRIG